MKDKSQAAFEAWLSTLPRRPHTPAAYDWCLATWQASRKQALEDVAEGFIKQKSWTRDYAFAVAEHAANEGAFK